MKDSYQLNQKEKLLRDFFIALQSAERRSILENVYEKGPIQYSDLAHASGFKVENFSEGSGRFAYHIRIIKRTGLIKKEKKMKGKNRGSYYEMTEEGKKIYAGIKSIESIIDFTFRQQQKLF